MRTDIENAIRTQSMLAIRAARERVQEAFLWAKKGVELLERIAPDANIDSRRRETARQLAQAQSKLLRVNPRAAREDAEAAYEVLQDKRREVTAGLGEQRGLLRQRDELRELASTR